MSGYVCPVCRNTEHLPDARFCMICGTPVINCSGCVNEEADRDQDCCWYCSRNHRKNRRDLYLRKDASNATMNDGVHDDNEGDEK